MKKVLIIDDDVNIVTLIRKRLEAVGYLVFDAADGTTGLRRIREIVPDLIILDVMMPGMDGLSVLREFKSNEELRHIPVVIVTAKGELADIFRIEGVTAIFEKPFKGDEIFIKIQGLLGA